MKPRLQCLISICGTLAALTPILASAAVDIPKDILKQRDPFKMPMIAAPEVPKSELESYSTSEFKLMGVLSGAQRRAMISSPSGKTFFVKPGMAIGKNGGVIRKITESALIVSEKVTNALGDQETQETVLKLPVDDEKNVKTITSGQGW